MANAAENTQHGPSEGAQYPDLVIVGAGLFGLTVAQQAVEHTGARVHIIDIRDHIGGNAYSYMDEEGVSYYGSSVRPRIALDSVVCLR